MLGTFLFIYFFWFWFAHIWRKTIHSGEERKTTLREARTVCGGVWQALDRDSSGRRPWAPRRGDAGGESGGRRSEPLGEERSVTYLRGVDRADVTLGSALGLCVLLTTSL